MPSHTMHILHKEKFHLVQVIQSRFYAYCLIQAQFSKSLSFPPSYHGFLIIDTNSSIKSLGTKKFLLITFTSLKMFILKANG